MEINNKGGAARGLKNGQETKQLELGEGGNEGLTDMSLLAPRGGTKHDPDKVCRYSQADLRRVS